MECIAFSVEGFAGFKRSERNGFPLNPSSKATEYTSSLVSPSVVSPLHLPIRGDFESGISPLVATSRWDRMATLIASGRQCQSSELTL